MVTFPISVEDESDDEKMVLWQRVWRLWTNEDGGELREDWKWKGRIFWHISLLKDKHISRVSWNTNAPKEYFDSHPSPLQRPQNAKGFEAKASLWPDFRDSDKGFQFMGTLLERFKSEGMAWARIRGWCVGLSIYGQIADGILRGRYSLTGNAWPVQCVALWTTHDLGSCTQMLQHMVQYHNMFATVVSLLVRFQCFLHKIRSRVQLSCSSALLRMFGCSLHRLILWAGMKDVRRKKGEGE